MRWQWQWAGNQLINTQLLVHPDFLDTPQQQLRTIIIPPDPDPLFNARVEPYTIDETDYRVTMDDNRRVTMAGDPRTVTIITPADTI